jgi:hypothetical protein
MAKTDSVEARLRAIAAEHGFAYDPSMTLLAFEVACLDSRASEYVIRRWDGTYADGSRGWATLRRAYIFRERDGWCGERGPHYWAPAACRVSQNCGPRVHRDSPRQDASGCVRASSHGWRPMLSRLALLRLDAAIRRARDALRPHDAVHADRG